jgi:hypothetical protein
MGLLDALLGPKTYRPLLRETNDGFMIFKAISIPFSPRSSVIISPQHQKITFEKGFGSKRDPKYEILFSDVMHVDYSYKAMSLN